MEIATRFALAILLFTGCLHADDLKRMKYNNPGLIVDLGVGLWAWPLPMDYDRDGDIDMVVSCPDKPYNGIYFFENPGGDAKMPVFKAPVKIRSGMANISVSYINGKPRVMTPGTEFHAFGDGNPNATRSVHTDGSIGNRSRKIRANQWKYVDFDGDDAMDIIVGQGHWSDYGWDDAYNDKGEWTNGPLHGHVYVLRNQGTTSSPDYTDPMQLQTTDGSVDVFGAPSPNFADFDGDGDLDLLCGEFLDGFTYFQNIGSRTDPKYAPGRVVTLGDSLLKMHLCMLVVTGLDWDRDGDTDLIVGQEDGRVALVEHTGKVLDGMPQFAAPRFFQQIADELKFGALSTPVGVDWDADGDDDIICGNTAGEIAFIENLDGKMPPKWAAPKLLAAGGETIRIMAGPNGSIQGPAEAKWGYTTQTVADWDHDGLLDIVVNSIWGKVIWYRNIGTKTEPRLAAAKPVQVAWKGGQAPKPAWNWWDPRGNNLVTQWRTTPVAVDWTRDGLVDLVMLDHEGYLALFERVDRDGNLLLLPGKRIFRKGNSESDSGPAPAKLDQLRLNAGRAGRSGRRKLCIVDWDGDGKKPGMLINATNAEYFRNVSDDNQNPVLVNVGGLSDYQLAKHTTSPSVIDLNKDGKPELLLGAEDGYIYHMATRSTPRKRTTAKPMLPAAHFGYEEFTLSGNGFTIGKLVPDGQAYANRNYVWKQIPDRFKNWSYTRKGGGVPVNIRISPLQSGTYYMITAPKQKGTDVKGWNPVPNAEFHYTDGGSTHMQVYSRRLTGGQALDLPQTNWSGCMILIPPTAKDARESKEQAALNKAKAPDQEHPNVLFIAVDDMRVELGCYGDTQAKSPNIDRLAARGMLFNRAYCQQAVCNPSRASMLTGLRLDTLDIWDLPTHFRDRRPNVITLPQMFKHNGYYTQGVGKIFHNWRQKIQGDPISWSVPQQMHYNTHGADKALVQGTVPNNLSPTPRTELRDVPDNAYFDGRIADTAGKTLQRIKDKRFFLAVGFWKPHSPFNAPKRYWDMYDRASITSPTNPNPPRNVPDIAMHDSREILRGFKSSKYPGGRPTAEDVITLRHGYYAAISYVDAQIGRVLDELDRLGLRDKTIVVLWSDHGFHLGEHRLWAKTSNFELDARVPLIIASPEHRGGLKTDSLVELLDVYPTLADLCNLTPPTDLEGKSLRSVLTDPTASVKAVALTQHPRPAYPAAGTNPKAMGYSIRTAEHRYTEWRDFATGRTIARELYDHGSDPGETVNLANEASMSELLTTLEGRIVEVAPRRRR